MPARVPDRLKLLRGTLRHHRTNWKAPVPKVGLPRKPGHLTPGAAKAWDKLTPLLKDMRIVTVADAHALELLCEALAEYREARAVLRSKGLTYETKTASGSVMERSRPECAVAADAWRRAKMMLSQFGLDPASRGRVETLPEERGNIFDDL